MSEPEFELTDLGNAERLVHLHGHDIRYCSKWNKWLIWTGTYWAVDGIARIDSMAKSVIRGMKGRAGKITDNDKAKVLWMHAHRTESHRRMRDMIDRASKEPQVQVAAEQFDTDPWLLNVRNGTINLKNGKLFPHRREDLITKVAGVHYDPVADCPVWLNFLSQVLDSDQDLIGFVRRFIGYTLTGVTSEQCLAMLYGMGANGKSTILEALRRLLGDYAQQASFDSFVVRREDGIRNDIARMRGARLVTAVEVTEGKQLAESTVKSLTGGDTITARFLYCEPFEFQPHFKIWMAVNHRPVIRGVDDGIWRRIKLVAFERCIPESDRDPHLLDKLTKELPGILAWAVLGCLEWQRCGLETAAAVAAATADYREESDTVATFIAECCVIGANCEVEASDLYGVFRIWCGVHGEKLISQTMFGRRLGDRGLKAVKSGTRKWTGIGLLKPRSAANDDHRSDGLDGLDCFSESLAREQI